VTKAGSFILLLFFQTVNIRINPWNVRRSARNEGLLERVMGITYDSQPFD